MPAGSGVHSSEWELKSALPGEHEQHVSAELRALADVRCSHVTFRHLSVYGKSHTSRAELPVNGEIYHKPGGQYATTVEYTQ